MFDLSPLVTIAVAFVAAEFGLAVAVGKLLGRASGAQLAEAPPRVVGRGRLVLPEPSSAAWN